MRRTTVRTASFEIAPVGILRAAAWPIESLDRFGDVNLAQMALAATTAIPWQQYVETYQQVFLREREILWQTTAEEARFMKALRLSNPIVSTKLQQYLPLWRQQARTKTIRRLENTLYRYLARAAGRTTPNGLWAGVGLVQFRETALNKSTSARYLFSPDLRPFQTMLRSLASQAVYRTSTHWQANPTLIRQADGSWRFFSRTGTGQVQRQEIEANQIIDVLLDELLKLKSGTFQELTQTIQASHQWRAVAESGWDTLLELQSILYSLADGGVLLGGLDLPRRFTNVWEALTSVAVQFNREHQNLWNDAIKRLQSLCDDLSANIEAISLDALENHLQAATNCVAQLAQALGVVLDELPNPILHCDFSLPFQVNLGKAQRSSLLQALQSYDRYWLKGLSPTTALRRLQRQQLQRQLEGGLALGEIEPNTAGKAVWSFPHTWAQLKVNADPEVINCLQEWEAILLRGEPEVYLEKSSKYADESLATAPLGCLYISPFENFQLVVHGIDDDPARAFARFGQFIDTNYELHIWLQERLQQIATQYRMTIVELHAPFEVNPNVLARCAFTSLAIDLWSASKETLVLRDAKISLDSVTQLPVVKLPSRTEPLAVFWFSSANISAGDPIADLLLYTGFQERPINFPASAMPVSVELKEPRYTPRIYLPGGAMMRSHRTVLSGNILQDIAQVLPTERYVKWQQLAAKHGWSELLNVQVDCEPGLLVRRDSPLAVEALFKSVRDGTQWVIVEEVVSTPWLTDADGKHYLAELALPFLRAEHGWSLRTNEHLTYTGI